MPQPDAPVAAGGPHWLARALPPLIAFMAFLGMWWLLTATIYAGQGFLVPSPTQVLAAVVENAHSLVYGALATLQESLLGFLSASILGIAIAGLLSQSAWLERGLYPYAVLLQTVPVVAIAPLIVLWFGYGSRSVVIISLIMALFPIINNTLLGLRSTSRNLVDLFAMHHTGRMATFWKLRMPAALPHLIAGLRISAGLSVIGAIVGEFIIGSGSAQGGLGVQIIFAQGRMYTALLFAEVIAATVLGFLLFSSVSTLGHALLKNWHESEIQE